MDSQNLAENVVSKMFDNDRFGNWLGITREFVAPGKCVLSMIVRDDMLNGFDILHGGISFSLADSALAFAANTYGNVAITMDSLVSYPKSVKVGERITATALEISKTNRTGRYDVEVKNQDNQIVTIFRGTVYITKKHHFKSKIEN